MGQGRLGEAISLLVASPNNNWGYLAYAYARAGRRAEAGRLMAKAPTLYPDRSGAFQYAGDGDCLRLLKRSKRINSRIRECRIYEP